MTFSRPSTGAILAASLLATQGQAQDHRPKAEGYPYAARGRLAVVQDDQGYSIRHQQAAGQITKPAAATVVPIGATLKIDAKIFALSIQASAEASHAPHR